MVAQLAFLAFYLRRPEPEAEVAATEGAVFLGLIPLILLVDRFLFRVIAQMKRASVVRAGESSEDRWLEAYWCRSDLYFSLKALAG